MFFFGGEDPDPAFVGNFSFLYPLSLAIKSRWGSADAQNDTVQETQLLDAAQSLRNARSSLRVIVGCFACWSCQISREFARNEQVIQQLQAEKIASHGESEKKEPTKINKNK